MSKIDLENELASIESDLWKKVFEIDEDLNKTTRIPKINERVLQLRRIERIIKEYAKHSFITLHPKLSSAFADQLQITQEQISILKNTSSEKANTTKANERIWWKKNDWLLFFLIKELIDNGFVDASGKGQAKSKYIIAKRFLDHEQTPFSKKDIRQSWKGFEENSPHPSGSELIDNILKNIKRIEDITKDMSFEEIIKKLSA